MHRKTWTFAALALGASLASAAPASAQGKPAFGLTSADDERDDYHGFQFTVPVANLNRETIAHVEMNLGGHATLSLEGGVKRAYEEVDEEEAAATGESRSSVATGGAVLFSRYTKPMSMAGFYWGLGVGYREETVTWRVRPDTADPEIDYTLVDQDLRLNHAARLTGTTGHLRVGYRYVGEELPFVGGVYLGARHFQAGVKDVDQDDAETATKLAAMTDRERERLRRKYATRPECGLEVGVRF